jgi:hypothetical protein
VACAFFFAKSIMAASVPPTDEAFTGRLAKRQPELYPWHRRDQRFMDILDRLDEMALAEDEIRRPWFSILTVISSISALAFLFKPETALTVALYLIPRKPTPKAKNLSLIFLLHHHPHGFRPTVEIARRWEFTGEPPIPGGEVNQHPNLFIQDQA